METVELRHLTIGYIVKGQQRIVVSDINATINASELTCLLGQNGIGKSTLLRTLSAFQPALSGEIYLDGTPLTALSSRQLSKKVGVVLTEKPDVRNMSVEEMVGMVSASKAYQANAAAAENVKTMIQSTLNI